MPATTYVALGTTTLTATAVTVTFSSISGSYTDLALSVFSNHSTSSTIDLQVKLNSLGGTNYNRIWWQHKASNGFTTGTGNGEAVLYAVGYFPNTNVSFSQFEVWSYSATTNVPYRRTSALEGSYNEHMAVRGGTVNTTSAITRIDIEPQGASYHFVTGSTFTLYGILKA